MVLSRPVIVGVAGGVAAIALAFVAAGGLEEIPHYAALVRERAERAYVTWIAPPVPRPVPHPQAADLLVVPPRVADLREGVSLELVVEHAGCYSPSSYLYVFTGPDPIRVSAYARANESKEKWELVQSFALAPERVARLDRLIAFYRHADLTKRLCTKYDTVVLTWIGTGEAEKYWDATCATNDDPTMMSLEALAQRARGTEWPDLR